MGFIADIGSLGESLFGKEETTSTAEFGTQATSARADVSGVGTKQLQLDPAAIQQIIKDILGADNGLASIFNAENQAGIFDSSVAQQAAGDLVSNIVGELAKITGKEVVTEDQSQQQSSLTEEERRSNSLVSNSGLLKESGVEKFYASVDNTIGFGGFESLRPPDTPFAEQVDANKEAVLGEDKDAGDEDSGNIVDENTAKSDEMAAAITDIVISAMAGG